MVMKYVSDQSAFCVEHLNSIMSTLMASMAEQGRYLGIAKDHCRDKTESTSLPKRYPSVNRRRQPMYELLHH